MSEIAAVRKRSTDGLPAILAASYLGSLLGLFANVQPLLLGALQDGYGLSAGDLGHVSAVAIGFTTVATASAPLWVRRVNGRLFSLLTLVATALVLACGAAIRNAALFLPFFMVLGLLKGAVGVPAFASLGDSASPARAYGVSLIFQAVTAAGGAMLLASYVFPHFGVPGFFILYAVYTITGVVACYWLPASSRTPNTTQHHAPEAPLLSAAAIPVIVAIVAMAVFVGGLYGFWYFIERIGKARGVSPSLIGVAFSLGALSSMVTASIVAWLGARFSGMTFVLAGSFLILTAFAVLQMDGNPAYVVSLLLFNLGWGLAQPGYSAIVRKVDATGRWFVASPVPVGFAGIAIGMAAGPVIGWGGYRGMILLSAILVTGAIGLVILAIQLASAHQARSTLKLAEV